MYDQCQGYLTDLRSCCAANVVTTSVAREPDAYRVSSNRLLERLSGRLYHGIITV